GALAARRAGRPRAAGAAGPDGRTRPPLPRGAHRSRRAPGVSGRAGAALGTYGPRPAPTDEVRARGGPDARGGPPPGEEGSRAGATSPGGDAGGHARPADAAPTPFPSRGGQPRPAPPSPRVRTGPRP